MVMFLAAHGLLLNTSLSANTALASRQVMSKIRHQTLLCQVVLSALSLSLYLSQILFASLQVTIVKPIA